MEHGRLGIFIDSVQLFRATVNELVLQQHHLCGESIGRLVALVDLPVPKRRIHSVEGKRSTSTSVSQFHANVAGEAGELREEEESLQPNLENPRSTSSVAIGGGRLSQVKTEVAPEFDAPRLTRSRARILQNAGANVTIVRGEPRTKKRRGRKGNVNPSDSPAAAVEEDVMAGKMQTTQLAQTALEHQSIDERPSQKPPLAVKMRNSNSRSLAETNGEVGKSGVNGEEQDMKVVEMGNGPTKVTRTVVVEEEDKAESRPSKKSRTSLGSPRLDSSSQAEANAYESDKLENARAHAHTSVEDHNGREGSATKRTRGTARATVLPPSVEIDAIAGMFETVGMNQTEADQLGNTLHPLKEENGMQPPEANMIPPSSHKRITRSSSRSPTETNRALGKNGVTAEEKDMKVVKIGDVLGNTVHPLKEGNGMESPQASMIPPSSQKRITRSSSRSPTETSRELGKNGVTGEEKDLKVVKIRDGLTQTTRTAEDEEEDKAEGRPSKKLRALLGSTRLDSSWRAAANAFELDMLQNSSANANSSVEDHNCREGSETKRPREPNGNAKATVHSPSVEIDGIVGKFENVGMNQTEGINPTVAADQLGNTLHPFQERNGMESPQANMITPSSQNGNVAERRITCGSANISEVNLADPDHMKVLRADQGLGLDCTDLPSDCLASAEGPPELNGEVEKNGVTGEEQVMKVVKMENGTTTTTRTAEEEGDEDKAERRPSKKSRASLGNARLDSSSQAEAFQLDKLENVRANAHASVEDHNRREGSATKRLREPNGNAGSTILPLSVEIDEIVGKLKTVDMNQIEGTLPTPAADQLGNILQPLKERNEMESPQANMIPPSSQKRITRSSSRSPTETNRELGKNGATGEEKDMKVVKIGGVFGNTLHPLKERNGMEAPQANMSTPLSQHGNAAELTVNYGPPKRSEVDLAAPDHVNPLRADRGLVLDCTDLSSECLASAEDPPESLLKQCAYSGSRRTTLLLTPPLKVKFVEREADVIMLDHPELKDEDTSSISEAVAEEQMEEQNPPQRLRESHPRRFSHLLAETDANPSRRTKVVAQSAREPFLAVKLDIKESKMDAIRGECANLQSPAVREASERIAETKDGIALLEVNISPSDRDGDTVGKGEFHCSSGTALQLPDSVAVSESSILPGQPPQTYITHKNSAGTPIKRERQPTELVTTAEPHREELVGEGSDGVRRTERRTLLLTTAEVHEEELVDVEAGAVITCSQLKINEGYHLFETSAVRDSHGVPNYTTSDVSHEDSRREGELEGIIPLVVDVNPSVGQVSRKETTGSLEDRQMNLSPVVPSVQVASSNIVNAQKPFSNLISGMKSFVPVIQQPLPSFIPDGRRVVKVKALIVAEAAKKAEEEKRDGKDWLKRLGRRAEDNASSGMEKKEAQEANIPLKRSVEGSKFDGEESSCGSQLSPRKQVLLPSNSRNLFNVEAKSKQATHSEIEKKVKKNIAELKRMEEERKRKLLASRQLKEQLVQQKIDKRQEILKQKKEQKLFADQEDKAQRHQASEDVEREKKATEEKIKSKQCTARPREKENIPVEELNVRGAGNGVLQTGQARIAQTPGKIRSNMLGAATLSSRAAVRVLVGSKDKQTAAMVAAAIQKKGRHPSSSSSSSKLLSLNSARLPSLNAESARLPSLNAGPARLSSLNAQSAAKGGPQNSTHAFSLGNRPADVQHQGRIGDNVSCSGTPCSRAVEKEQDLGPTSYEISPYRGSSDDESEDETKPAKHVPFWARKVNLEPHLLKQVAMDPDEIFSGWKTCSLKEVFGKTGSKKIEDFGKRSGSGDWFRDRVSWREELQYKIEMGYVQQTNP